MFNQGPGENCRSMYLVQEYHCVRVNCHQVSARTSPEGVDDIHVITNHYPHFEFAVILDIGPVPLSYRGADGDALSL